MAIISLPTWLRTGPVDYAVEFDVQISVSRNGKIFTYGLPGARWVAALTFEAEYENTRARLEAFLISLEGGANRLQMHHIMRPVPNGTLRGSPTVLSSVSAGAYSVPLDNCNGTLKAGDFIGIGGQTVMAMADATPVANAMTVAVKPALRMPAAPGAAVTWNKPTSLWIPKSATAGPFPHLQGGVCPSFSVEFVEAP